MIPTHTDTYTSIKCTEIILKWFPLPYLILTLATSYKLHLSEARARILALLHAIRNDRLYSGNLCMKKKKTTTIKEEKIKTFHKLCFQASLVWYEGPISWFSPGQLKVVNQQNKMHCWHPGLLGCSSVHSIDTVKQKPAQETHSYAIRMKAFTILCQPFITTLWWIGCHLFQKNVACIAVTAPSPFSSQQA